jgi:predicted unusual protein kinase regulating ubiquinone biosynthesis (AarF/ABC1/UbiB family)
MSDSSETNRFSARASRYARVGLGLGGVAARMAVARVMGGTDNNAQALTQVLGGLKGPIMKVAQLLATVPDLLPPEYANELQSLQSQAPPMGTAFVKRRMQSELGPDWRDRFASFDLAPCAAASLGQVHKAVSHGGQNLACKLQYPDMASAVAADLSQLELAFSLHKRLDKAIDTTEIAHEIGERIREELDYIREAKHARLYGELLKDAEDVRVPQVEADLSTPRLLTMQWLEGDKITGFETASLDIRNRLAVALFTAWWQPFTHAAIIHGDPHLGNYTVFSENDEPVGINLLDYGCIRIFPPQFLAGVSDLYRGLLHNNRAQITDAYEQWGFKGLNQELTGILNIWARFIFGPLLDDRVRTIADGVAPSDYGRREAFQVHQALREKGPITIPREFVFMDRAAIGLGAVFLRLRAELNFHRLFEEAMEGFNVEKVAQKQKMLMEKVGL